MVLKNQTVFNRYTHTHRCCLHALSLFTLAKASKAEKKLCGFAFMRLTDDEDIVIKDAFHNLCIYKVSK